MAPELLNGSSNKVSEKVSRTTMTISFSDMVHEKGACTQLDGQSSMCNLPLVEKFFKLLSTDSTNILRIRKALERK